MKSSFNPSFGRFNPNFQGIRFIIKTQESWQLFLECAVNENIYEDIIKPIELSGNTDLALKYYAYSTVAGHEYKHFIDSNLSTLTNYLFRLKSNNSINSRLLFESLRKKSKAIGLPIQEWILNSNSSISKVNGFIKEYELGENLSDYSFDENEKNAAIGIQKQNKYLRNLFANPDTKIQPEHIFEGAAILVQMQDIHNAYGEQQKYLFLNTLSKISPKYTKAIDALYNKSSIENNINLWSLIFTWSILGNYEFDTNPFDSCPSNRFTILLKNVDIEQTSLNYEKDPIRVMNLWNDQLGYPSTEKSLKGLIDSNERNLHNLSKISHIKEQVYTDILKGLTEKTILTKKFINQFLENPQNFIFPNKIIHSVKDRKFPIILEFECDIFLKKDEAESLFDLRSYDTYENEVIKLRRGVLKYSSQKNTIFDDKVATELKDDMIASEYLYSDSRDNEDFEIPKRTLRQAGYIPIEIELL